MELPARARAIAFGVALSIVSPSSVWATYAPAPPGAAEGEVLEIDSDLYVVRDGQLVPIEEALAEPEERPAAIGGADGEAPRAPPPVPGISVTGSRVDTSPEQVMETDVVGGDDIAETGARTLSDALSQVAGLQITSSLGTGDEVSIDGLDGKYVLILVDGRPVNGRVNNRVDTSRLPISPSEIERVEVVRGPMSALYGSDALGGVINIVTKRPGAGVRGGLDLSTRLTGQGLGRSGLGAQLSGSAGPVLFKLGTSGLLERAIDRASRDLDAGVVVMRPDGQLDLPHRRQGTATGELGVFLGDDWLARLYGTASGNEVETRVSPLLPYRDHSVDGQLQLGVVLEGDVLPGHALVVDVRVDRFTHRYEKLPDGVSRSTPPFCEDKSSSGLRFFDAPCPAAANVRSDTTQDQARAELRYTGELVRGQPLVEELRLSAGLVLAGEQAVRFNGDGEDTLPGGGDRLATALYGELMYRPFSKRDGFGLSILPGARLDLVTPGAGTDPAAFALGPKLGARLELPFGLAVRASYGQGFRLPSFQERYLRFDHSELGYIVEGNADLRPETSQGLRGEVLWRPLPKVEIGVEGFLNLLADLIGEQLKGPDPACADDPELCNVPVYTYANIARAYTAGVNLRLSTGEMRGFSFDLAYQYLINAVDASACPEDNPWFCAPQEGARSLPLRPAHAGHGRVRYRLRATDTTLFSRVDFLDERPLGDGLVAPGYVLLGAGLSQPVMDGVDLLASFENLLDTYDPVYGPKPGRHVNLTLRGAF